MKHYILYIMCIFMVLSYSATGFAQNVIGQDINEMLKNAETKYNETVKEKKKKEKKKNKRTRKDKEENPKIEDLSPSNIIPIGTINSIFDDMTWGDPVYNPQIRKNLASNLFGMVRYNADGTKRMHRGFDYYAPVGTDVLSVGYGTVFRVETYGDYGQCITIEHVRGQKTYYSFYAHLSFMLVNEGDIVKKGMVIGKSGITGNAYNLTGDEEHLHFECRLEPEHSAHKQINPNEIVYTHFYSANPKAAYQSNVEVIKK